MIRRARRRTRDSTTLVVALVLALGGAACQGPREPLEVGVRKVASDIVLGTQGRKPPAAVASPIPPAPVAVNIPTPVRIPAPPRFEPPPPRPTVAPEPEACPEAHPLSVPRHPAPDTAGEPPVEESFLFANAGTFTVTGANANEGVFDQPTTRRVENVVGRDAEDITYDVVAELGDTTTTSSYEMRNISPVDDGFGVVGQANVDEQRGLYLRRVASDLPDGGTSVFAPAAPMRILRFPVFVGDTFDEVGTDPLTGTVMSWTATVTAAVKVDACGEFIDAFEVELTDGRVDGPSQAVDFAATYAIATQYGGLIVRDRVVVSGTEGSDTITRTNEAVITRVPTHHTEAGA